MIVIYVFLIIWVISTLVMTLIVKKVNEEDSDPVFTKNRQYFFIGSLLGLALSITLTIFIAKGFLNYPL